MIPANKKYFVYPDCVDGRKSFNGLAGIIRSELQGNPAGGDVQMCLLLCRLFIFSFIQLLGLFFG